MTVTLSAPLVRLLMVRVAAERGEPIAAVKAALALLEDRGYVRTDREGETELLAKAFTRRTR